MSDPETNISAPGETTPPANHADATPSRDKTSIKYFAIIHAGLGTVIVLWLQQILANPSDVEVILAQFLTAALVSTMVGLLSLGALLLMQDRPARSQKSWQNRWPVYAKLIAFLSMAAAFVCIVWGIVACIGAFDTTGNDDASGEASSIDLQTPVATVNVRDKI